ncbi:MAG: hypothetical protein Q8Q46_02605 [Candidatus Giovannonibacteria bacterium]|nr:hypothetical protein [Candidatus Giovannonibacteria bacterium]
MREHGGKEADIVDGREQSIGAGKEHRMRSDELDVVAKRQTLFLVRFACASLIKSGKTGSIYIIPTN